MNGQGKSGSVSGLDFRSQGQSGVRKRQGLGRDRQGQYSKEDRVRVRVRIKVRIYESGSVRGSKKTPWAGQGLAESGRGSQG